MKPREPRKVVERKDLGRMIIKSHRFGFAVMPWWLRLKRLWSRALCFLNGHKEFVDSRFDWVAPDGSARHRILYSCRRKCGWSLEVTDSKTVFEEIRNEVHEGFMKISGLADMGRKPLKLVTLETPAGAEKYVIGADKAIPESDIPPEFQGRTGLHPVDITLSDNVTRAKEIYERIDEGIKDLHRFPPYLPPSDSK